MHVDLHRCDTSDQQEMCKLQNARTAGSRDLISAPFSLLFHTLRIFPYGYPVQQTRLQTRRRPALLWNGSDQEMARLPSRSAVVLLLLLAGKCPPR